MKNGNMDAVERMFHLLFPIAQQIGLDDKQLADAARKGIRCYDGLYQWLS